MKFFRYLTVVFFGTFFANAAYASPTFLIDSAQSYVSAYAPTWTAYNYTPFYLSGPGAPPPPAPTVIWNLAWTLENFQLSGNFQGITEASPWDPAWAHLTISNQGLQNQLPSYVQGLTLPGQITYAVSGGGVFQVDPCGINDPFYGSSISGSCWFLHAYYLAGTFDGETLALTGEGSGLFFSPPIASLPPGVYQQIADPGPPPPLDASQYPTNWVSYQIVATAVPEPGTLVLVLIGGLAFIIRSEKYRVSNNFCT